MNPATLKDMAKLWLGPFQPFAIGAPAALYGLDNVHVTIDPANVAVFFRLIYP